MQDRLVLSLLISAVLSAPLAADAGHLPEAGQVTTNSIGMNLVRVRPGSFLMGSPDTEPGRDNDEGPVHRVEITRGFDAGIYEVTRGQFAAFVEESGYVTEAERQGWSLAWRNGKMERIPGSSWRNPGFGQDDSHPVVCVSWNDAAAFCGWLGQKENRIYRLPTEAQWEYCCRAGTETRFSFGNRYEDLCRYGNYADAAAQDYPPDGHEFTAPAGSYAPNAFGIYDMHGNVWEWCLDLQDHRYYSASPKKDPPGPAGAGGGYRVQRGGAWCDGPRKCRSANRNRGTQAYRFSNTGFRVVAEE
jgi:formylglycine-generating enzyme required for sulfatase activity